MDIKNSQSILDSIRRIVQTLRIASRRAEINFGMSGAQLFVLQALKDGTPLTINQLGERTYTHQSSVSIVAAKLEKAGLVLRTRSPVDARQREIKITSKGKDSLKIRMELSQSKLLKGVAKLSTGEQHLLAVLLRKLVKESGFSGLPAKMFFEENG